MTTPISSGERCVTLCNRLQKHEISYRICHKYAKSAIYQPHLETTENVATLENNVLQHLTQAR
ncbi:hypothetical protein HMPREF3196_00142 [Bifidobacterium bifidum]|uniref:Uncharacterized protein n=1 Tax=Bifidobacterium bifidum TaxID=1681 RepID=A0A133KTD0_BIFBI|nr:hypothetical protein HMPREF3196_00142 [Bifidobacterium bifidum]